VLSFWYADSAEKKVTRKPLSKVESSISLKNTVARLGGSVGKVTTSPGIVNVYADKTQAADGKVYVLYPVTEVLNLTVPAARKRARTGGLIDMDTVMPKNTVKASGGYVLVEASQLNGRVIKKVLTKQLGKGDTILLNYNRSYSTKVIGTGADSNAVNAFSEELQALTKESPYFRDLANPGYSERPAGIAYTARGLNMDGGVTVFAKSITPEIYKAHQKSLHMMETGEEPMDIDQPENVKGGEADPSDNQDKQTIGKKRAQETPAGPVSKKTKTRATDALKKSEELLK
jgi:hypothetical protein